MTYIAQWLDYSARTISGAKIKAAGCTGVIRYIDSPDRLTHKHTTKAEYQDHVANGLDVQLVMEVDTDDPDGGYTQGVAYAQRAKAGSEYLGYSGLIYFANDRSELPNPGAWTAYLEGAASVWGMNRTGAYGFANALNAAVGHASGFWQAGRESDLVPHADVYQWNNGRVKVDGVECDLNKVIRIHDLGGGSSPEIEDEDEMPEPKRQPASPGVRNDVLYWNGQFEGILNIVGVSDVVWMGKPLCWGPNGGTGGGNAVVSGVNPSKVEVNQPGSYHIPKGTTRVFYSYSSNGEHYAGIERSA